jgi:hypothetical protein
VKIHPVEAKLFHADRWMDRQDEAFHNIADVPNKRLYIKRIILQRRGISRLCHVKRRSFNHAGFYLIGAADSLFWGEENCNGLWN